VIAAAGVWRGHRIDAPHGFFGNSLSDQGMDQLAGVILPGGRAAALSQVHGSRCVTAGADWRSSDRPEADAIVTDQPGLVLAIVTADCVPVLLADPHARVVGAAHAGWKGALAGVTDTVVAAMESLGAERSRICAAIGPCIARASYEVDAPLFRRFAEADPANERFFIDGLADHWQFDLEAYVAARLADAGLTEVEALGLDTYAREQDFYSFRRATHRGEPTGGRQLSMIGLGG